MFGFVNQVVLIKVFQFFFFLRKLINKFCFLLSFKGKGIYLVRDIEGLKKKFTEIDGIDKKKQQINLKPMKRIIQRFSFFFFIFI